MLITSVLFCLATGTALNSIFAASGNALRTEALT